MAHFKLGDYAFFAAPTLVLLLSILASNTASLLPFVLSVFHLLILILAKPRLVREKFRALAALVVTCAMLGVALAPSAAWDDGVWLTAALSACLGICCCAAALVLQGSRDDEFMEMKTLINTVPALLWTADGTTAGVNYINQVWQELGWTLEDLEGDKWGDMMHPGDIDRLRVRWQHSVETGERYEETMRVRRRWGEYRWMVIRATPEFDATGGVRRWYGVANDIDDLKKAEERLEGMRRDLARVVRANTMGELTASIAHEINQPLAAAVTNGQVAMRWLAAETPDTSEIAEAVEESVAGAKRASDVVERLRKLYQKSDTEPVPIDIAAVIDDSVTLLASTARSSDIALMVEKPDTIAMVMGDAIQLQQVLVNLVVNGIDAIRSTSAETGSVSIGVRIKDDGITIEVEDSGPGLSASDKERLFDAFYSTKSSGLGMGLAICRSIIERMDGRITGENSARGGALFSVSLPVATTAGLAATGPD
nr:ATP-binding protein [Marinicella sp. W31]MDC2876112.1 ATP-binding protein [Marinicella sp. W31]